MIMKGTDIQKVGLPEASYVLDLCLHHNPYVNGKYGFFQRIAAFINILFISKR